MKYSTYTQQTFTSSSLTLTFSSGQNGPLGAPTAVTLVGGVVTGSNPFRGIFL